MLEKRWLYLAIVIFWRWLLNDGVYGKTPKFKVRKTIKGDGFSAVADMDGCIGITTDIIYGGRYVHGLLIAHEVSHLVSNLKRVTDFCLKIVIILQCIFMITIFNMCPTIIIVGYPELFFAMECGDWNATNRFYSFTLMKMFGGKFYCEAHSCVIAEIYYDHANQIQKDLFNELFDKDVEFENSFFSYYPRRSELEILKPLFQGEFEKILPEIKVWMKELEVQTRLKVIPRV